MKAHLFARWRWVLPGLWLAASASAAVVDQFSCDVTITDPKGAVAVSLNECPDIVRRPSPLSHVWETWSAYELKLEVPALGTRFTYQLHFEHALQSVASGTSLAAQHLCQAGEFIADSNAVAEACMPASPDPFSPVTDWQLVKNDGGVPVFDPRALHPYSLAIKTAEGIWTARVECQYMGTQK